MAGQIALTLLFLALAGVFVAWGCLDDGDDSDDEWAGW